MQVQNHHVPQREEHSSCTTEKESSTKHGKGNHSSQSNGPSPLVKDEPGELHKNQSSVMNLISKSVEEERHISSDDGTVPLQKQSGAKSSGNDQLSTHLYQIPKQEPERCNGGEALSLKGEKSSSDDSPRVEHSPLGIEKQKMKESTEQEKGGETQLCLVKVVKTSPVVLNGESAMSVPSKIQEKGLVDGYNWRKYGQKLVKGNEFVRGYYRCTFPNCPAKRQVERSYDWCKTDVIYLGDHQHLEPKSSCDVQTEEEKPVPSLRDSNSDERAENQQMASKETMPRSIVSSSDSVVRLASQQETVRETLASSDNANSKRQKRDINFADKLLNSHTNDPRNAVDQTFSVGDSVDDGYRWRKYGQKIVKGRPYPRSYYRCSNTSCPAKKQVERASHDPKVAVTTYEGQHNHGMPPPPPRT